MSEGKLTFTQAELDEAIGRELRKARAELSAEVEKAAEEAAASVPDYKALYEAAKAEREKFEAENEAARAEQAAQEARSAKRRAIINRFFNGDNDRIYRADDDAVAALMHWFPDLDKFADEREAEQAAWDLKFKLPGLMQEILKKANKKQTGGLFRRKGRN